MQILSIFLQARALCLQGSTCLERYYSCQPLCKVVVFNKKQALIFFIQAGKTLLFLLISPSFSLLAGLGVYDVMVSGCTGELESL